MERERGLTIDHTYWKCETPLHMLTVVDAPGHERFVSLEASLNALLIDPRQVHEERDYWC